MSRRANLRNLAVAILSVVLVYALASGDLAAPVAAQSNIQVTPSNPTVSVPPGGSGSVNLTITNVGGLPNSVDRTFTFSFQSVPAGFTPLQPSPVFIAAGGSQQVPITINSTSATQAPGTYTGAVITIQGSGGGNNISVAVPLTIIVTGATFTPTPTQTRTPAPPTATPTRGPICVDGFEPNDDRSQARPLDVNAPQDHAMCPSGDVDWLVFGGVQGKVYTIDVSAMAPGIDLTLELFNDRGESIAFNDDFYDRDPANPNPGDIRPRIQSFTIPYDGPYFIRVRDAAGRGAVNYTYTIALLDESYGPTPTLVPEVCLDLFEPDGLPEQARLITSNELQEIRRLCPSGDADWVTFFGKAGKRYIIYTETSRYRGRNTVNGTTQAGADTVMVLTDRDGVSIIDFNDDIPGGNTLDSQIEFTPQVDGFYFLQIKNVGDIGNQFIRYDLVLLLCLPGQTDCGRVAPSQSQPANPVTPNPTGTPADEFVIDPTATPTATSTTRP